MNTQRIAKTLKMIVSLLASRQYEQLYLLDIEKYLPAEDMPEFIDDYGGTIGLPPDDRWDYDFYPITDTDSIAIDYQLYVDGKPSYLTLKCTLTDRFDSRGYYEFAIESIHIL